MPARTAVFVLGVHRSGTSALTSVVAGLGFDLGFVPVEKGSDNEAGYFEHPGFRRINDAILATLGATWDNWALTADHVAARLADLQTAHGARARDFLADMPGQGAYVLKDPRAVATWPFWQAVTGAMGLDVRLVLILRDPREVARSQVTRAADWPTRDAGLTTPEPVHALWTIAMHRLLHHLPATGATLVLHRDLIAEPDRVARGLAAGLGTAPADADQAAALIRPDLYRARQDAAPAGAGPWQAASARLYAALAADPAPRALDRAAADTLPQIDAMLPLLGAFRESHASLRAEVTRLSADLRQARADLATAPRAPADPALADIRAALESLAGAQLGEVVRLTLLRAQVSDQAGNLPEAERLLRRAIEFVPTHQDSWKRLIALLTRQHRTEEAKAARAQARARCPGNPAFD